jgi:hypothetical protein
MKHEEESTDSVLAENEVTPTELETFAKPTSDGPEEARAAAVEAAEKRLFAAWEAALARFNYLIGFTCMHRDWLVLSLPNAFQFQVSRGESSY